MSIRVEIKNPHVNTVALRARCRQSEASIVLTPGQSGALDIESLDGIHIEVLSTKEQERLEAGA